MFLYVGRLWIVKVLLEQPLLKSRILVAAAALEIVHSVTKVLLLFFPSSCLLLLLFKLLLPLSMYNARRARSLLLLLDEGSLRKG